MKMTENEAIERLKCMRLFMEINDKQNESKFLEDDYIANKTAIQALEEIQQYRAIGTVEDIEKDIRQSEEEFDMLMEYRKIGTIEEFKDLKEKETEILLKDGQFLYQQGLVDGYAKAIEEFKTLKEKNVAKKPLPKGTQQEDIGKEISEKARAIFDYYSDNELNR